MKEIRVVRVEVTRNNYQIYFAEVETDHFILLESDNCQCNSEEELLKQFEDRRKAMHKNVIVFELINNQHVATGFKPSLL